MFFAKQLYEMTHIDLGYDTDSIVKVHLNAMNANSLPLKQNI